LKHDACSAASFEIEGYRGADLLIVDDPVKNSMEANSAIKRDALW
jgi:hypothetical protein